MMGGGYRGGLLGRRGPPRTPSLDTGQAGTQRQTLQPLHREWLRRSHPKPLQRLQHDLLHPGGDTVTPGPVHSTQPRAQISELLPAGWLCGASVPTRWWSGLWDRWGCGASPVPAFSPGPRAARLSPPLSRGALGEALGCSALTRGPPRVSVRCCAKGLHHHLILSTPPLLTVGQ